MNQAEARRVADAPRMTEVAPNRWVQMDLGIAPPEVVLCDVVPMPGQAGVFKLVPRSWEHLVHVTPELCHRLGMDGDSTTLRRLIRAGFVDGSRYAPKSYTVNLASYFAHLKRCAEDPDFWEDAKVIKQYQEGYF